MRISPTALTIGALALAATILSPAAASATTDPTPTPTPTAEAKSALAPAAVPSASAATECAKVTLTFTNPTKWAWSFDYKVDNQRPKLPPLSKDTIKEGPYAGKKFDWRYNPVTVAPGQTKTVPVTFRPKTGDHAVTYWLQAGPEQKMFLLPVKVEVDTYCRTKTVAPEFKQPKCSDKNAHIVIANTPGVRYSYGFKTLNVGDNVVKAGSKGYVVAKATNPAVVLWGKTTWPVAFVEAPSTYTCS